MRLERLWLLAALGGVAAPAAAQEAPAARPADVESVDAVIAALYDVISGPAGQERDWGRFRSLFAPGSRLMPTGRDQTGKGRLLGWTPDDYVRMAGANLQRDGFFEREIGRVTERYGNIVQAFSSYDSKRSLSDAAPFMRGINSIRLWHDGSRWWIVNIFWESESPSNPIPPKYLKTGH